MNTLTARDILLSTTEENQNRADRAWQILLQSRLWSATPSLRPNAEQVRAAWLMFDQMLTGFGILPAGFDEHIYFQLRYPRVFPANPVTIPLPRAS